MPQEATASAMPASRSFSPAFQRELNDLFAWRRDVRHFRADPVPEATLSRIIAAAGSAPSVGLSEPWRLVRVDSDASRGAAIANFEAANEAALSGQADETRDAYAALKLAGLHDAPVHLAVFCDDATEQGKGLGAATMPEMRRYSVVCAVMQMWLAARAMGVGMGWVSILDPARLANDLRVDPDWSLVAYLCIGWPAQEHLDCELERENWERRRRLTDRVLTR